MIEKQLLPLQTGGVSAGGNMMISSKPHSTTHKTGKTRQYCSMVVHASQLGKAGLVGLDEVVVGIEIKRKKKKL